jgi:CubicO group peptidase (beta-lactamase class C family)
VLESTQPSQDFFPQYGYLWWLPDFADVPPDTFEARGIQAKHIYVIPSLDIVAVRLGEADESWDGNAFLKPIVEAVTD